MKCIDCKTKNINDANYCTNCCHQFSEKEKQKAHNKTFIGLIENVEKAYNICSFKVITSHILFKIISIVIILGVGIYTVISSGNELRIEQSNNYEISYNQKDNEYYLKVNKPETSLNLYFPNKLNEIVIKHWSKDNQLLEESKYNKEDNIEMNTNTNEDYYTIEAIYSKTNRDTLKLYLYEEK